MKTKNLIAFFFTVFIFAQAAAQVLKPGYVKAEYREMLLIAAQTTADTAFSKNFDLPSGYELRYQSPEMGFQNLWQLWRSTTDSVAVISVRGTTTEPTSWLANFYAAMIAAKGQLQLSENNIFEYHLADDPKAAVHVGWLLSMAFLQEDILPKIDSCYAAGIRDFIITGHSQGGGISYLLTAYLYDLQSEGRFPKDIRFKTYCSAAPKPGNLYFAYHYENITQGGWAFNVVNTSDWVPEMPISIQTLDDFNTTNPFKNIETVIEKQNLKQRVALNYAYKKLYKPAEKARENYEKFLGDYTSKEVQKILPGFVPPDYFKSNNYVRTGTTIVLDGDAGYHENFPDNDSTIFIHHIMKPYLYLLDHSTD